MDLLLPDLMKAMLGLGPGGIVAGFMFYLWRQRGEEITKADAKIEELQNKIQAMLQAQLEGEPQRRQTLADITRAIADNTALLKERLLPT